MQASRSSYHAQLVNYTGDESHVFANTSYGPNNYLQIADNIRGMLKTCATARTAPAPVIQTSP